MLLSYFIQKIPFAEKALSDPPKNYAETKIKKAVKPALLLCDSFS